MNRLFKLPLLIALTLGSTQLLAVDFGQVRVLSSLGQPLLAEIPLHGASPAELKSLTASLASPGEYERAGIVGGRTSVPLSFSVVAGPGGEHFIRISSSAPVDDPFLDLLLDVNTAAGNSVHEFAILLDPASAAEAPIAGAQAPARAPAATTAPATPSAAAPATQPAATRPAAAPAAAGGQAAGAVVKGMYGPVERGQTLSGIAQQTLPAGVDINQMLLALKQANPDAFYRDNINTLKAGVVLRVPSATDAQAMTVAAAIAEVRRQNGEWRAGEVGAPAAVAAAAARPSSSNAASAGAATGGDRLALLAAKDTTGTGNGGNAANAAGQSAAELRKSLLQAQETLASERQQVADLQAHVKQLDDLNSKSERLLSLKDNQIAELQARLAAARKAGFAAPAPSATSAAASAAAAVATAQSAARALAAAAPAAAASSPAAAPAGAGSAGVAAVASSVAAGAEASPAPASSVKPVPAPAAAKPAVAQQPWYMQTWAWIAGAGIVVLLILGGLLGRQRKRPASPSGRTAPSLADSFGAAAAVGDSPADDVDHGELLDQLAEHPDDLGLHLQLVTLYYSRRDVEHFEAAAEAMYAHIADPQQDEWQDVVHMGEDLVPGHPLFSHQGQQPDMQAHDVPLEDFNIDDYADDTTVVAPVTATSAAMEEPTGYPTAADVPLEFGDTAAPAGLHAVSDQLDVSPDRAVAETAADTGAEAPEGPATPPATPEGDGVDDQLGEFNDDPIDTKLDLARAYLDMGDEEGARAMLDEVLKEGSQMQKDVATGLLGGLQT